MVACIDVCMGLHGCTHRWVCMGLHGCGQLFTWLWSVGQHSRIVVIMFVVALSLVIIA